MANIGTLTARLGLDTKALKTGAAQARGTFSGLEKSAVGSMGAIAASIGKMAAAFGVVMVGAKLIGAFKNMVTIGADFEYTMATVGGVMRATGDEMKSLTAIAKKMGETTEWTASQSGEALKFLGMAGFDAAKAIKALPGVLDLATAGNIELGRAADIATNALTAMGLPVRQLTRINDVFVGTITRSNTNMEMMAESFKYAAPSAKAYGYSLEELSGLIGALGDAGIQGSMGGTQLAQAFLKAGVIAEKMGLQSSELLDVLEALRGKGYETTEIMRMFGLRAGKAVGVLVDRIPEVRAFQETLTDVGGEAKTLANIMRDTLKGSFAELKSVIQSVAIDALGMFGGKLDESVKAITEWVRENKAQMLMFIDVFTSGLSTIASVIGHIVDQVSSFTGAIVGFFDTTDYEAMETKEAIVELAGSYKELTDQMISLNKQLDLGTIATTEYKDAVADAFIGAEKQVVESSNTIIDTILKTSKNAQEARERMFAAFREGLLPPEMVFNTLGLVDEMFEKLHRLQRYELAGFVIDWSGSWAVIRDNTADSVADINKIVEGLLRQGIVFENIKFLRTALIEEFGYAADIVDKYLGNIVSSTAEAAREMEAALALTTPPPVEIRLDTEAFKDDIELATEQFDKLQQALSEKIQALTQLQDIHFKASLVGLDEITQQKLTIERKYQDMLKAIYASEVLSFAEKEQAKIDLAILTDEELRKLLEGASQEAYKAAQFIGQQMDRMTDAMVSNIREAGVDMRRIFTRMAIDFLKFFIKQSISAMQYQFVGPFLNFLKLFDKAANDRMAMKQGERFIGFFSQGARREMARMDLAPALAQMNLSPELAQMNLSPAIATASASGISTSAPSSFESHTPRKSDINITMHVNAPIISDDLADWIVHDMAPVIERAAKAGQTRIALEPFVQTGESGGIIN